MAEILSLFSRRNMLTGLAGGAAATAALIGTTGGAFARVLKPSNAARRNVALGAAGYDAWSAQVGSKFMASSGQVLKLVDVESLPAKGVKPRNVRDQAFVARFEVSTGGTLPEQLYRVAHPEGGTFEMFLTRTGPDQPQRMLAVFA